MIISIDKRYSCAHYDIDISYINNLANFALSQARAPKNSELSISFVDDTEIQNLNKEFRGIDKVTDVLSFECDNVNDECNSEINAPVCLGDIVIAPVYVDAHRHEYGTSFLEELSLVLVHGCLHVLGYDHIKEDEAEAMEELEKKILDAYGLKGIR